MAVAPGSQLTESQRLKLIVEAVRYCQRVKEMGMPASSYSKALREPIYFLWECQETRNKERVAAFRSKASIGLRFGTGELVYDHSVPFKYLQVELLELSEVTVETVAAALRRYRAGVLITKEEDVRLNAAGYRSKMPKDWDGADHLARYKAVGIEIVNNVMR
jgi:hypothetical protein